MAIYLAEWSRWLFCIVPWWRSHWNYTPPPLIVDVFCEQYCIESIVVIDIVVYAIKGNFVLADWSFWHFSTVNDLLIFCSTEWRSWLILIPDCFVPNKSPQSAKQVVFCFMYVKCTYCFSVFNQISYIQNVTRLNTIIHWNL